MSHVRVEPSVVVHDRVAPLPQENERQCSLLLSDQGGKGVDRHENLQGIDKLLVLSLAGMLLQPWRTTATTISEAPAEADRMG